MPSKRRFCSFYYYNYYYFFSASLKLYRFSDYITGRSTQFVLPRSVCRRTGGGYDGDDNDYNNNNDNSNINSDDRKFLSCVNNRLQNISKASSYYNINIKRRRQLFASVVVAAQSLYKYHSSVYTYSINLHVHTDYTICKY